MKRIEARLIFITLLFSLLAITGCGYTSHSLLPEHYKTIYVENFKNSINISAEQSDQRMYRGYTPGMEIDVTRAVRDGFLVDGNLKVAKGPDADLIMNGELIDFKRDRKSVV
jgi:hypothetical protein